MNKGKLFLILGVVLGLISAFMTYTYIKGATKTEAVYVFTEDVEAGTPLDSGLFERKEMPVAAIPSDAITDVREVDGKSVKGFTLAGSILRLGMLEETSDTRISGKLLENYDADTRAVAFQATIDTTVGGSVKAGDLVNVYGLDSNSKTVVLVAKGVEVIKGVAVDNEKNNQSQQNSAVVIAFRSDKQVEKLADALAKGSKLFVSLLPFGADAPDVTDEEMNDKKKDDEPIDAEKMLEKEEGEPAPKDGQQKESDN